MVWFCWVESASEELLLKRRYINWRLRLRYYIYYSRERQTETETDIERQRQTDNRQTEADSDRQRDIKRHTARWIDSSRETDWQTGIGRHRPTDGHTDRALNSYRQRVLSACPCSAKPIVIVILLYQIDFRRPSLPPSLPPSHHATGITSMLFHSPS